MIPRFAILWAAPILAIAGPYPDNDGIAADDSALTVWASSAVVQRGPVDATVPEGALASYGVVSDVLGAADSYAPENPYPVLSLGDGGSATLRLAIPACNQAGPDLAVFENGFSSSFLELAHVEVSSDGVHFVRFPSVSLTSTAVQGSSIDPTGLHNLAGKYEAGIGTPFDLDDLQGTNPHLDVSHITHVRVIDVVGSIDPSYGTTDSLGNMINDPFTTPFGSGGFDLDAVGALHASPTTPVLWASLHFPSGEEDGDDDDPDGDRIPNLLEYAIASDPNATSARPLLLTPGSSNTVLTWNRATGRNGVNLYLEGSNNLLLWTELTESEGAASTSSIAPGVTVEETPDASTVTASVTANYTFFRLKAER